MFGYDIFKIVFFLYATVIPFPVEKAFDEVEIKNLNLYLKMSLKYHC